MLYFIASFAVISTVRVPLAVVPLAAVEEVAVEVLAGVDDALEAAVELSLRPQPDVTRATSAATRRIRVFMTERLSRDPQGLQPGVVKIPAI
jgi:hypothetical protein